MPDEAKDDAQDQKDADGADPDDPEAEEENIEEEEKIRRDMGYRANLKLAQDLARDDPRIVANVIKGWLGSNE